MLSHVLTSDNLAKDRVYSAGFDYITLANEFCPNVASGGIANCTESNATGQLSIVVTCGEKEVSYQVGGSAPRARSHAHAAAPVAAARRPSRPCARL
jgi:hypothetical protein